MSEILGQQPIRREVGTEFAGHDFFRRMKRQADDKV